MGHIGVPGVRLELTGVGEAVNIVTGLNRLTRPFEVLISGATVARLEEHELRELPAVCRQGKEPVRVFTLPSIRPTGCLRGGLK